MRLGERHHQARRAMRLEPMESTLQATGLVHEAYRRLVDQRRVVWRSRAHFFGVSAKLMRRILVDHSRARLGGKRGGAVTYLDSTSCCKRWTQSPFAAGAGIGFFTGLGTGARVGALSCSGSCRALSANPVRRAPARVPVRAAPMRFLPS